MASLNWNITGVNRDQIANEIATLRARSETFRRLEQMALDEGYRNVEVTMGPRPPRSSIGSSFQSEQDRSVRHVRISSNGTATFGVGGRQITVGEIIAHELAHGVVPPEVAPRRNWDVRNNSPEEVWVRRQTGAVAADLGLPGPDNADFPITEVPIDREQACTFNNIQGNTPRDGVLFLDGSRGSNGLGSASTRRRSGSIDPGVNPVGAPGTAAGRGWEVLPKRPLTRRRPGRQQTARMMLHRSSPIRLRAPLWLPPPPRATRSNLGRPIRTVFRSRPRIRSILWPNNLAYETSLRRSNHSGKKYRANGLSSS
jgi:hypothetical protein